MSADDARAAGPARAGLALLDRDSAKVVRGLWFQYNPASLRRSFLADADREAPARVRETVGFELELDAADPGRDPSAASRKAERGVLPALSALEAVVSQALDRHVLVLVWGRGRLMPVRPLALTIQEEEFDAQLDPIRARVAVELEVLADEALPPAGRRVVEHYRAERANLARRGEAAASTCASALAPLTRRPRPPSG